MQKHIIFILIKQFIGIAALFSILNLPANQIEKEIHSCSLLNYANNIYSQRGEDGIIAEILSRLNIKNGFFVEFGAMDGVFCSTQLLAEQGWDGVYIEDNLEYFQLLNRNHKHLSNVLCLNYLVTWNENDIRGMTLDRIADLYFPNKEIDFLSIHVNGADFLILESLKRKPKIICVAGGFVWNPRFTKRVPDEVSLANLQQPLAVMIEMGKQHGYEPICFTQNVFFIRKDLYSNFVNIRNDTLTLWQDAWNYHLDLHEWLLNFRQNPFIRLIEGPEFEKINLIKQYHFNYEPIDVIIPCRSKDIRTLNHCIWGIRNNCSQIRRIIVISEIPLTNEAEWLDECFFPFNKETIAFHLFKGNPSLAYHYITQPYSRVGWYQQQLLKLYAPFVIPNLSSNVLVLDADAIFINPVYFTNSQCAALFNPGAEYHPPYFDHATRPIPNFKKQFPQYSGISHHMLFQKCILEDLFATVEATHHKELWKVFCECVDLNHVYGSGASEYEIYFNFAFDKCVQVEIRPLAWTNIADLDNLMEYKAQGYHYITCHDYVRK